MGAMADFFPIWFNVSLLLIGIASFILVSKSRAKLTKGLVYTLYTRILMTITFLVCSSILHIFSFFFAWESYVGEAANYPEYLFIAATYFSLLFTALEMAEIGKEFGFKGTKR